jgi:hypothetical protein
MTDWMKPQEAASYLGVRPEDLTRIIMENDIDVQLDDAGVVLAIDAADLREPLFEEHRKKVGYRPDDLKQQEKAQKEQEEKGEREKEERKSRLEQLSGQIKVPHE